MSVCRKLILLSFLLFTSNPVLITGQNKLTKPEFYTGLNGGVTGSMINFNPSVSQKYLLGYNGGISMRYIGNKYTGIVLEINYSQRGWEETDKLYARQLNYIEVPFLSHFFFGKQTQFFFNIGPKISYLVSEKVISNLTSDNSVQHITNIQNKFDYGFCASTGLMFKIKKQVIIFDTKFNYSVSDIFSNNQRDYFNYSNNINLSVNLGWQINLLK